MTASTAARDAATRHAATRLSLLPVLAEHRLEAVQLHPLTYLGGAGAEHHDAPIEPLAAAIAASACSSSGRPRWRASSWASQSGAPLPRPDESPILDGAASINAGGSSPAR